MVTLIVQLATTIRAVLAHAPSNRLASRLRARGGLGSALAGPVILVARAAADGTTKFATGVSLVCR